MREQLDPDNVLPATRAGFELGTPPQLLAFPFAAGKWRLHHACPFAAVRWTNIHDPAQLVAFGDLISGPLAHVFGHGVIDVNLRGLRGQAWHFSHTDYWKMDDSASVPKHVEELRTALDLGGRQRKL